MNDKQIKSWLKELIENMVDNPESVIIKINKFEGNVLEIRIYIHLNDVKMIIGKRGKNIQALRTIIYAMMAKKNIRCYLSVEENII